MIWQSITIMTLVDCAIISFVVIVFASLIKHNKVSIHLGLFNNLILIYAGIVLLALFFITDLIIMHVFPVFMPMKQAMGFMENLHLNVSWFWLLTSVAIICIGLVRLVSKIIPKLNETFNRLEYVSNIKTIFLSQMSHELRTPLHAILGFAQVMKIDKLNPLSELQNKRVSEIQVAGKHMLILMNDLLDLTKLEKGTIDVELQLMPVSLSKQVDESLILVREMASNKNISIKNLINDTNLLVIADPTRLQQVLINLLTNAIKYNIPDGEIELSVEITDADFVTITVSDNGMGIAASNHERIFEPFERVVNDKITVEGIGVGLALTKHLVELMGGEIKLESSENVGTTFRISMPISLTQ